MEQPITRCCFNHNGQIFAYAVSYDWSKVNIKVYTIIEKSHLLNIIINEIY